MPGLIPAASGPVSPATLAIPAAAAPNSLTLAQADQTITFGALANKAYGDGDFAVSATASSGLDVSFAAAGHCT